MLWQLSVEFPGPFWCISRKKGQLIRDWVLTGSEDCAACSRVQRTQCTSTRRRDGQRVWRQWLGRQLQQRSRPFLQLHFPDASSPSCSFGYGSRASTHCQQNWVSAGLVFVVICKLAICQKWFSKMLKQDAVQVCSTVEENYNVCCLIWMC